MNRRILISTSAALVVVITIALFLSFASKPDPLIPDSLSKDLDLQSQDSDGDGVLEYYATYWGGKVICQPRHLNQEGTPSEWAYAEAGEDRVVLKDLNGDGRLDWWEVRSDKGHGLVQADSDFDGTPDPPRQVIYFVAP